MVRGRLTAAAILALIVLVCAMARRQSIDSMPLDQNHAGTTSPRRLKMPKQAEIKVPYGSPEFKDQLKSLANQVATPPGPSGAQNLDQLYAQGLELLRTDEKSFKKDALDVLRHPEDMSPRLGFFLTDVLIKGSQNPAPELAQVLGQKSASDAHVEGGLSDDEKNAILKAHALSVIRQEIATDGNANRFSSASMKEELLQIVQSEPDVALVRSASRTLLAIDPTTKPTLSTLIHARNPNEYFAYQDLGL